MQRVLFSVNFSFPQQNLKHDDTFIYLNAIGGLSAMAFSFPDTVLDVLCEEFLECREIEGHEVRIKVGEVLVNTTKSLGNFTVWSLLTVTVHYCRKVEKILHLII